MALMIKAVSKLRIPCCFWKKNVELSSTGVVCVFPPRNFKSVESQPGQPASQAVSEYHHCVLHHHRISVQVLAVNKSSVKELKFGRSSIRRSFFPGPPSLPCFLFYDKDLMLHGMCYANIRTADKLQIAFFGLVVRWRSNKQISSWFCRLLRI